MTSIYILCLICVACTIVACQHNSQRTPQSIRSEDSKPKTNEQRAAEVAERAAQYNRR